MQNIHVVAEELAEKLVDFYGKLGAKIAVRFKVRTLDDWLIPTTALLDTGATVSLVEKSYLEATRLKIKSRIDYPLSNLAGVQGGHVGNEGVVRLSLRFGNREKDHDFVVLTSMSLPTPMLIGTDFLSQYNILLEHQTSPVGEEGQWRLKIAGVKIPLNIRQPHKIALISLEDTEEREDPKEYIHKCKAAEPVLLTASSAGYVTLITTQTGPKMH